MNKVGCGHELFLRQPTTTARCKQIPKTYYDEFKNILKKYSEFLLSAFFFVDYENYMKDLHPK